MNLSFYSIIGRSQSYEGDTNQCSSIYWVQIAGGEGVKTLLF